MKHGVGTMEFKKKGVYFGIFPLDKVISKTAGDTERVDLPIPMEMSTAVTGNGGRNTAKELMSTRTPP